MSKDNIEKVDKWLKKEYGDNFVFNEEVEDKHTMQYTNIGTPCGRIVLLHVSPSTKGDTSKVFWNFTKGSK